MFKLSINLNEISKAQRFVNTVSKYEEDIDLIRGRYIIDARSIMGIFSLDLSMPIEVAINTDDKDVIDRFITDMEQFN